MDTTTTGIKHERMPAKARTAFKKLYIGEWMVRLNCSREDMQEAAGIGKAYLSQLISGKKKNPSTAILMSIAAKLGLKLEDLYKPPPPAETIDSLKGLSADVLARLVAEQRSRK